MRQISILFACLIAFLSTVYAQGPGNLKTPGLEILKRSLPLTTSNSETVIRRSCGMATLLNDKPLLVIDGIVAGDFELKKINPEDIESIWILKGSEATTLYGCTVAASGVVIITTKTGNQRTITVKDLSSGEPLSAATVELIYSKHKENAIRLLADSLGRVKINKIIPGTKYELRVSNIGYKTYSVLIDDAAIKKNYSVMLQRNYSELKEVVVVAYPPTVCRRIISHTCTQMLSCVQKDVALITSFEDSVVSKNQSRKTQLYPNPVMRLQKIYIEFEGKQAKVTLKLFSLDYKLINSKEYEATNGINQITFFIKSQLSSGMYIIQLFDEKNYLISSEKLIIH